MDCDSNLSDDNTQYVYTGRSYSPSGTPIDITKRVKTDNYLGWSGTKDLTGQLWDISEPYTAWHVHPLSPVTLETGALGKFDFNCNKNDAEGYDFKSLVTGGTPFDWDINTGIENSVVQTQLVPNRERDLMSYRPPVLYGPMQKISFVAGAVAVGVGVFALPGVGIAMGIAPLASTLSATATFAGATASVTAFGAGYTNIMDGIYTNNANKMLMGGTTIILSAVDLGITSYRVVKIFRSKKPMMIPIAGEDSESILAKRNAKGGGAPTPVTNGGCFLENTSILLANGEYIPIQNIKEGNFVTAYDLEKNKSVNASITHLFIRNETRYRIIKYKVVD
jgi:hypothetical protein